VGEEVAQQYTNTVAGCSSEEEMPSQLVFYNKKMAERLANLPPEELMKVEERRNYLRDQANAGPLITKEHLAATVPGWNELTQEAQEELHRVRRLEQIQRYVF
jgi:hypothetical protein